MAERSQSTRKQQREDIKRAQDAALAAAAREAHERRLAEEQLEAELREEAEQQLAELAAQIGTPPPAGATDSAKKPRAKVKTARERTPKAPKVAKEPKTPKVDAAEPKARAKKPKAAKPAPTKKPSTELVRVTSSPAVVVHAPATLTPVHTATQSPPVGRRLLRVGFDLLTFVAGVVVLSLLFKMFVFRAFFVPSESMDPTLQAEDHIAVELISSHFTGYQQGDVVVFRDTGDWLGDASPETPGFLEVIGLLPERSGYLVKRVIGVPGDTVTGAADGSITVNGTVLPEPYVTAPAPQAPFAVTLATDEYFMLGDNRGNSSDSRANGPVLKEDFVGKAVFVFQPAERVGPVE